jgi:hypothetical protein
MAMLFAVRRAAGLSYFKYGKSRDISCQVLERIRDCVPEWAFGPDVDR